jgi:hypothetical protein
MGKEVFSLFGTRGAVRMSKMISSADQASGGCTLIVTRECLVGVCGALGRLNS